MVLENDGSRGFRKTAFVILVAIEALSGFLEGGFEDFWNM